jgi:hypothetical protein
VSEAGLRGPKNAMSRGSTGPFNRPASGTGVMLATIIDGIGARKFG